MTHEQAIQNLENLINVSLQRGLFQNTAEVLAMSESLEVLRNKHEAVIGHDFADIIAKDQNKYVTTSSADIKDN